MTLIELMIVVVILGIIGAIAVPSYKAYITTGNRADGIAAMLKLSTLMEKYYTVNDSYASASVATLMGATTSKEGKYTLTMSSASGSGSPDAFGYMLKATPVSTDAECGYLTITSSGAKGSEKSSADLCW